MLMISVIIPLYNKEGLIGRALASVAAQQAGDCEILVVDDGSTDNGVDEVKDFASGYAPGRLRIISQANAGVAAARNRGIAEARGEYVTFLDADDAWKPGFLEAMRTLAGRYPQCGVFASNYENVSPDGKVFHNRLSGIPFSGDNGIIDNYFEMAAGSNPPVCSSAVMVRRDAMQSIGGFPLGIKSGEDLLTWARLAARYGVAYCMKPLSVYYRGHSNPRPPEAVDEVGRQLEALYRELPGTPGLKRYLALWYNMRMSRCLAHRMYGRAWKALCKSLRYHPTPRIAKPLLKFTIVGLRKR